ncbi:hypothetical protein BDP27DRAFT_1257849 [Rhodocollybia butyracea]|uniref:Lectin n=1 Tax=Rhodocollybia butyracea TaxID=206335 RepID=A0A9P5Q5A8_9AGAR|nr:hypothetical protein BDP27DRAFT_1257849 [Rhodocollybia butyracea]
MILSRFLLCALTTFGVIGSINAQTDTGSGGSTPAIPTLNGEMQWIWAGDAQDNTMRAFRFKLPKGATCVTFAISADDAYTVWVNGAQIGNNTWKPPGGSAWNTLDVYSVSLSYSTNVIAVNATNNVNVAGVMLTGFVQYYDGSQTTIFTNSSWLTAGAVSPPDGFQEVYFDDSTWVGATEKGGKDTSPWAPLTIGPFTGKTCGQSDDPDHSYPSPSTCSYLPPLSIGARSPYWELSYRANCEVKRIEQSWRTCQSEKQDLINRLIVFIGSIPNVDVCNLVHCDTPHSSVRIIEGVHTQVVI